MKHLLLREKFKALWAGNQLAEKLNYHNTNPATFINSIISAGVTFTNRPVSGYGISSEQGPGKLYIYVADDLNEIQRKETLTIETVKWYFQRVKLFDKDLDGYALIGAAAFLIPDRLFLGRNFQNIEDIMTEFGVSYRTAETRSTLQEFQVESPLLQGWDEYLSKLLIY
jgi:hypothetical protein